MYYSDTTANRERLSNYHDLKVGVSRVRELGAWAGSMLLPFNGAVRVSLLVGNPQTRRWTLSFCTASLQHGHEATGIACSSFGIEARYGGRVGHSKYPTIALSSTRYVHGDIVIAEFICDSVSRKHAGLEITKFFLGTLINC